MGVQVAPLVPSPLWPLCFLWLSPPPQLAICLHHGALLICILTTSQYPCVQVESSAQPEGGSHGFVSVRGPLHPPVLTPLWPFVQLLDLVYLSALEIPPLGGTSGLCPSHCLPSPVLPPSSQMLRTESLMLSWTPIFLSYTVSDANHQHLLVRVIQ